MTHSSIPSFIISGTSSGSGKTTVALGLMAAFKKRGLDVQPYKCGPDFIDPGLHKLVTAEISRNLDPWMCGEEFTRKTFYANLKNRDLGIIEGVMGMFDGGSSSSGALSTLLDIPNILVLDVRSMAESAAAIVKGFETIEPDGTPVRVPGVILNRIGSKRHLELVSTAIKKHCSAEILGYLPRSVEFSIPSRHLGLLTGDEAPVSPEAIDKLTKTVEKHIDLDRLLSLCKQRQDLTSDLGPVRPSPVANQNEKTCRIGVARDKAFCFYYEDNFDLLRAKGAELIFFSPLTDDKLPENLDGVYLGGGYPELYAKELSRNRNMIEDLRNWVESGRVVYGECGGFMYLTEGIYDLEDTFSPMVGCFPVKAVMQKTRASLGYREVKTTRSCCFGPAGTVLRGHEFHYSTIKSMDKEIERIYEVNNNTLEGFRYKRVLGGYMHLHFGYSPQVVDSFINYCREK